MLFPTNPILDLVWDGHQSNARYDAETGDNYTIKPTHPDPNILLRFNWNAAIAKDHLILKLFILEVNSFIRVKTKASLGKSFQDLTTNDKSKQKQSDSGGLTLDATGAENHCTLLVIEPSLGTKYAVDSLGRLTSSLHSGWRNSG